MPELPDLASLTAIVEAQPGARNALERLTAAEALAADLARLADRLIGYYIEQARAQGHSWADIGTHLGISRQAAQQRYTPRWASLTLTDLAQAGAFTRLTPRTTDALRNAEDHARRLGHDTVAPEHLLLGILDDSNTLAVTALRGLNVDLDEVRTSIDQQLPATDTPAPPAIPVGAAARRALEAALVEALELGHNYIGTEHLLLGLLHDRHTTTSRILGSHGVTLQTARASVQAVISDYLRNRG